MLLKSLRQSLTALVIVFAASAPAMAQDAFADYRSYGNYQGSDCRKPGEGGFPGLAKQGWWICPYGKTALWEIHMQKKIALFISLSSCESPLSVAFAGSNQSEGHQFLRNYGKDPFSNEQTKMYYYALAKSAGQYLQFINKCSPIDGKFNVVGDFSALHKGLTGLVYSAPWSPDNKGLSIVGQPSTKCEFNHISRMYNHENNDPCIVVLDN